ncbi:MAG: recombination protein O N-terminal domain-containing protein [Candidatus Pacebacteria bacterium]|nr:recombination protein O N-terminal domain-containing protein [Candidatus Paceibacterota bacterium]
MAHHIYHTRGVILGSSMAGESSRFYKIFTEELGLISARAQAVRESKSKLRYSLQDFSWAYLDLVRGKEVWRITSAGECEKLTKNGENSTKLPVITTNNPQFKLFADACSFIERFVQGESRDDYLFLDLFELALFLGRETIPLRLTLSLKTLAKMRTLARLGYLNGNPYKEFLKSGDWSLNLLEIFEKVRAKAISHIDEAFSASHL